MLRGICLRSQPPRLAKAGNKNIRHISFHAVKPAAFGFAAISILPNFFLGWKDRLKCRAVRGKNCYSPPSQGGVAAEQTGRLRNGKASFNARKALRFSTSKNNTLQLERIKKIGITRTVPYERKCGGCFLFPAFARVTTYLTHPGNNGVRRNVIPRLCKAGWLRIHKMLPKASFDGADGAVGPVAQPPNMPRSAPYYPPD